MSVVMKQQVISNHMVIFFIESLLMVLFLSLEDLIFSLNHRNVMSHNQQPVTDSGAQKRNPFDYIADDDDDFGDFTSAVSFTHSLNGGFHSAPRPPAVTNNGSVFFNPLPLAQDEIEEDDEFGDFCAQPSVRIEEPVVVPAVKCQPNYNIDLEIDSCLSWNEPLPAIAATVQQQQPELEIEEEEFSQFTSAPEPPTEAPVDLFDSQPVGGGDLFSLTNDVTSLLVLEPTPTVEAVQVAVVEDEFGDFEQAVINEEPLDLVVPLVLFNPVQETTEMQPTEEDHSSVHVISEIIVDPVPVEPSPLPQIPVEEEKDDDFGDFASFQQAAEQVVFEQEDDDDGYDDYEIARPPPVDGLASLEVEEDIQQTSEVRLKRLLNTIFPYAEPAAVATSSPTCLSPLSSRGALWSYVSQLDSTPALSFQWRHSTAHQRFLNSIKIDSIQQQVDFVIDIYLTRFCTD